MAASNEAEAIVGDLQQFPLCTSKDAIMADDTVVMALFAPAKQVHVPSAHLPQSLSLVFNGDSQLLQEIYQTFQIRKPEIDIKSKASFLKVFKSVKAELVRSRENQRFRSLPKSTQRLIEWCLQAYAMVISPSSLVQLKTVRMGPSMGKGFSVFAQYDIPYHASIWELVGMMPGDNRARHSNLSSITPHKEQNQSPKVPRILFGPLRMVNHRCKSFNVAYMAVRNTSAFVAFATRDIAAGEELTVNYGGKWFAAMGCPCTDCQTKGPALPVYTVAPDRAPPSALTERALAVKAARRAEVQAKVKMVAKTRDVERLKEAERERKRRNKQKQREKAAAAKTGSIL